MPTAAVEIDSQPETGPSTARDVTQPVSVLALMQHSADAALNTGPRPAAYQPRLRTDSITRAPLMYESANLTKLDGYEAHGAAIAPAVTAMDMMKAAIESVVTARNKSAKDPELMHSEASQVLRVADYADKLMTPALQKVDAANAHLSTQIKAVEADLNKAITGSAHSALASEIRAHAKAQKSPMQFVSELIQSGDEQSVSAVLGAPAYLSGLTQQMRDALTQQWNSKRNPALTEKLTLLRAAQERLERAGTTLLSTIERGMGVKYDMVKRLRDAKAAASF